MWRALDFTGINWMKKMPHATRRAFLSLPLGDLIPRSAFVDVAELRNRSVGSEFVAQSGVNVVPLGFEIYKPVTISSWDEAMPQSRLRYLKQVGFDHVRIAFDPTPALNAAGEEQLQTVLGVAKHALDMTLQADLKAILDLHVATSGPWSTYLIEAAYPDGEKWAKFLTIAKRFGLLCGTYDPKIVAFELYNENSNNEAFGNKNWAMRCYALWQAVRSINQRTTLLVGGSFYSSIEGLNDLEADKFDQNTGFVVHNYNPTIFTHQNAASYTRFVERLHYPPIESDRVHAISEMTDRVNASELSGPEKTKVIADRVSRLSNYFDRPQGAAYFNAKLNEVVSWAHNNHVAGPRIFVTEFGSHNDHDRRGAALISRLAWTQDADSAHEACGFCRSLWNYNSPDYWDVTKEDGSWQIRDNFLLALGHISAEQRVAPSSGNGTRWLTPPAPIEGALFNGTVQALKDYGLWEKLDLLYVFAAGDVKNSYTSWKLGPKPAFDSENIDFIKNAGVTNQKLKPGFIMTGERLSKYQGELAEGSHLGLFLFSDNNLVDIEIKSEPEGSSLSIKRTGVVASLPSNKTLLARPRFDVQSSVIANSTPGGAQLYINGSISSADDEVPSKSNVAFRSCSIQFGLGNTAACSAIHAGTTLTPDDAKNLYTILRFCLNGLRR